MRPPVVVGVVLGSLVLLFVSLLITAHVYVKPRILDMEWWRRRLGATHARLYVMAEHMLAVLREFGFSDVWAMSGTAIGVMREGTIIPWDETWTLGCFRWTGSWTSSG
jgi:hypothetical protein